MSVYRTIGPLVLSLSQAVLKVKNSTVLISTDNTTVVVYIRLQGGTHSTELTEEVWNVLNLCLTHNIQLLVKHIPGRFNTLADQMSRVDKPISTEWSLNQEIANNRPVRHTSEPQAAIICVTHTGSEGAINRCPIDGLESHTRFVFPPFHLIPAVINKIRLSQCRKSLNEFEIRPDATTGFHGNR